MTTCACERVSPSKSHYYGELETLEAMQKFRRFYEDKMKEIDGDGGGDCLELKLKLQEKWINDLTEQTEMMARIVKELEDEATSRVQMLEERLRQTSKTAYEVMKRYQTYNITHNLDEPFQKVFYLENDLKNLIEFIRRKRNGGSWCIDGLQFYEVSLDDLFGLSKDGTCSDPVCNGSSENKKESSDKEEKEKHAAFEEVLHKKNEEYEALKQSMLDMRSALTEEVACKHDMISALKKDVQQLEERCVQADKQTAFKDDIIKELRKEIKQLKQQSKKERVEEVEELERKLEEAENLIRSMRPCVETRTACTAVEDMQWQVKDKRLEDEIYRRKVEVENLKCRCQELECALQDSHARADNLQKAVDLYLNSINVLEASEERARIEIEQQRVTITNLQEALVSVKQELDDLRQKDQQEVEDRQFLNNVLFANILDLEEKNEAFIFEIAQLANSYKKLQDCSFDLEVEHFNSLQDLAILETQLSKCHNDFKSFEESAKIEVKKLRHQKRCYQHALECLKNEMTVMSEQLISLQEILNLSKQSCIEDKGQLHNAIVNLQKVCDSLHEKLIEAEKKSVVETQMNQLKDQKIDELQIIIGQKNADLNVHDAAIHELKLKLENAIIENHELQNTVTSLNTTLVQLRCDTSKAAIKKNTVNFREGAEGKVGCFDKLQMDYKSQTEMLKSLQREFERAKEKDKEKTKVLKRQIETLQDKLAKSESYNHKLINELELLRDQAISLGDKDYCREQQLVESKNIILELRQTLIELNESLINSELHHSTLAEVFENKVKDERQQEDVYLSCKCEIALYKRLVEDLKETLTNLKNKYADVESQNKNLRDGLKHKENKIDDLQAELAKRDRRTCENIKELEEKLKISQTEEKRLSQFIEELKKEVHKKLVQNSNNENRKTKVVSTNNNGNRGISLANAESESSVVGCLCGNDNKETKARKCGCSNENKHTKMSNNENKNARIVGCACNNPTTEVRIVGCACNDDDASNDTKLSGCQCDDAEQLDASYQEIKILKSQIKKLLQSQFSLNNEVTSLQTSLSALEEKNRQLKQKLEKSQCENQKLKEQIKVVQREKEILAQTVSNLEVELADVRNNRDDVCAESKHVVNNVKAWLEEQKKINDKVKKRAQCYCETITKLKQENANLSNQPCPKNYSKVGSLKCYNPCAQSPPPASCTPTSFDYSWCLGSQGMDSPRDSPTSCQTCSFEEWYSPNFRDETDIETDLEDEFINRLQAATLEMKNNNKKWKNKKDCECLVTKDKK